MIDEATAFGKAAQGRSVKAASMARSHRLRRHASNENRGVGRSLPLSAKERTAPGSVDDTTPFVADGHRKLHPVEPDLSGIHSWLAPT
jgi:hypothetical protein